PLGAEIPQRAEPEDLRRGLEQFGDVRRPFRAVEPATQAEPVGHFPVAKDLVGPAAAGRIVIRIASAQLETERLDERNIRQDRDQQLAVNFADVIAAERVAARIDTNSLIQIGLTLIGDGVVDEFVVQRAVTGADRDRKSTRLNSSHVKISYA